ncbi:hypothetical protein P9A16_32340 [Shinella sp. 838]|jgi:hypothetical protein|uniref:hypothetical protein n=1 Tax=unclassified Shinella TaxID=2643062 RepID=UPI0003C55046|nr:MULTISPECIES: hypothetical protein [unclassified Shinella]EYR82367.1 hypothetical protein SHLA_7c000820 [Shinella sp. DD12]MCA0342368.1 hypothetical protein [Pseudomonadota bacterium]MDG4675793.1 hypothetical protein [Shinella sp. 838]
MFVSKSLLRMTFVAALAPTLALAGPLTDAARKAEEQAAAGDTVGAHNTIRDAFGAFAATLPFSIGKAVFVSAAPEGYGMYAVRPEASFKVGEALISYVEPVGLTWRPGDGGLLESHFTVDLELLDPKGTVLAEQKAFGSFDFKGSVRNQEVFAKLTLNLSGPPVGDYVLRYRFRDAASGAVAISEQPFKIVP